MSRSGRRFLGGLLTAAGGLLAALSGLCTLAVLANAIPSFFQSPGQAPGLLILMAVFGGAPFAVGVALVVAGLSLLKEPRKPDPAEFS